MLRPPSPLLSCTGRIIWCSVHWLWLLFRFSCVVTSDVQQLVAVSVDPHRAPPLDNTSPSWTPTEGLLLSSINAAVPDVVLWGPVIVHPWMAFVSASTPCDRASQEVFFTKDGLNYTSAVSYDPKHAIKNEVPLLTTVKGVYTASACIMACIQSKNFTCRSVDYFWKDGGRCALYNFTGQRINIDAPYYSTTADSSDHYDLLVDGNCSQEGVPYKSHNFATIAWTAFAVGWLELAAYEFDKAIRTGEKPLTAYLGRTLCNDDFGFSGVNSSYKKDILKTLNSTDLALRLSKQEKLYFRALADLFRASNLTQGSALFAATIDEAVKAAVNTTVADMSQHALGLTLRGVALLQVDLRLGVEALANRVQSRDMTAMAYVTRRFDPYNNGPQVLPYFDYAVQAATTFHLIYLNPQGLLCADLIRSSINVLEAYAQWAAAAKMATTFSDPNWLDWLVGRNLLVRKKGTYYLKDVELVYITRDEQVILYERAHFHLLQAGLFNNATDMASFIRGALSTSNRSFERAVVYRVLATAYYTSSGNIYDSYAANLTFASSAVTEQAEDELMKWSVGYHQLALYLQNTSRADCSSTSAAYAGLQLLLERYVNTTNPQSTTATALSMFLLIAKSRERENNGNMREALEAGRKASELQATLANAAPFVQSTKYFRQLFPIGHVYYGELLKRAFDRQNGTKRIKLVDACQAALLSAALWLPRNISTAILSLSKLYSSEERFKPEIALSYLETLINSWNSTSRIDTKHGFPGYYDAFSLKSKLQFIVPDTPICTSSFYGNGVFWTVISIAIAAIITAGVTVLTCRLCNGTKKASCIKHVRSESKLSFKEMLSTASLPLLATPHNEEYASHRQH